MNESFSLFLFKFIVRDSIWNVSFNNMKSYNAEIDEQVKKHSLKY